MSAAVVSSFAEERREVAALTGLREDFDRAALGLAAAFFAPPFAGLALFAIAFLLI
jgi:hypothetical protein